MSEEKKRYFCRICGDEISQEQYENHDGLCDFSEQDEEDEEDFDLIGEAARTNQEPRP